MAKLDLALVVRTVDQATGPLRRIQRGVQTMVQRTGLDRFGRGLARVGRGAQRMAASAGRHLRRLSMVGAAVGAAGFFMGQKYAKAADNIAKTSDRIGVSVEELQELRHAFDIGGASVEQTDRALQYFARAIGEAHKGTGEAIEIFEAMGIELKNADGSLKTTGDLLDEVADAMANQEDPAKKAFAAQRLFGRAGMALINTLDDGASAMRATGAEMQQYGVITDQEARNAEAYIDAQARLKRAFAGLYNAIGAELIPVLTPMVDKFREWLSDADNRERAVQSLVDGFKTLKDAAQAALEVIQALVDAYRFFNEATTDVSNIMVGAATDAPVRQSLLESTAGPGAAPRGGGGGGRRGPGSARVTVDFKNMPRGTRTETRADDDTDLEVMTGYAMQGAN